MKYLALLLFFIITNAHALTLKRCNIVYFPQKNVQSFAPIGKELAVGKNLCNNEYLIIPFDQVSNAITLKSGMYEAIDDNRQYTIYNTLDIQNNNKISSCLFCDPIKYLKVFKNNENSLCVTTLLNVDSCAVKNTIVFNKSYKQTLENLKCSESLVYMGISNNTIYFKYKSCKDNTSYDLKYDLNLSDTIRFLNTTYQIIKADNLGLEYKIL